MNFSDPDRIAHSANMLVCIGGLASATGLIAGAGAAVSGYLSYREIRKRLPAGAKGLADELGKELAARLAEPGLNEDTRRLIPQMIEASLPSPQRVMEAGHDGAALVEMMAARLTDREHKRPDHLAPFRRIVGQLLDRLLADTQFADELAPAFRRQVLADAQAIKAGIESLEAQFGSLSEALGHVGVLGKASRDQMEALASRFEIERVFDIGDADLRALLEAKAEEYRAYKAQIDMIDERTAGLGNLKAAAQEAADRLDLEEVERLLSMVHATELDIAAKTAELRADNALLRGRVEEAYRMLSAAADSFAAVDPLEPARRRVIYAERLHDHGLRFGGSGLARAAEMWRAALRVYTEEDHPAEWAMTQNNLANALAQQGRRTGGTDGTIGLADAIDAYRAALRVYTEKDYPAAWAATQNNLAITLRNQGTRAAAPNGDALRAGAIDAFRAALRVYTEKDHPLEWAMTQTNLATTLTDEGNRTDRTGGGALIAEAVNVFRAALRVYTEQDHPNEWAATQNNLAIALRNQSVRTNGPSGAALLSEAIATWRAALRVRTERDYPVDWATTQNNLGNALREQGVRTGGEAGAALLAQAVDACRAALRVCTENENPADWATTQGSLAVVEEARAGHETCIDPRKHLQAALAHIDAALRVFDPVHMPHDHSKVEALRTRIQSKLDAL